MIKIFCNQKNAHTNILLFGYRVTVIFNGMYVIENIMSLPFYY